MTVVSSPDAGGVLARRMFPAVLIIPAAVGWLRWQAEQHGLLDEVMGLSLSVVANIVILSAFVWWNAVSLTGWTAIGAGRSVAWGCSTRRRGVLAESPRLEDAVLGVLQAVCDGLGWTAGSMWWVDRQSGRSAVRGPLARAVARWSRNSRP